MTQDLYTPSPRDEAHGKRAIVLLAAIFLLIVLSILAAFRANDVTGTYRFVYAVDAEGVRDTARDTAFRLERDGTATFYSANTPVSRGTWSKSFNTVTVRFGNQTAVFHRSGDTLTEHKSGGRTVFRRD